MYASGKIISYRDSDQDSLFWNEYQVKKTYYPSHIKKGIEDV